MTRNIVQDIHLPDYPLKLVIIKHAFIGGILNHDRFERRTKGLHGLVVMIRDFVPCAVDLFQDASFIVMDGCRCFPFLIGCSGQQIVRIVLISDVLFCGINGLYHVVVFIILEVESLDKRINNCGSVICAIILITAFIAHRIGLRDITSHFVIFIRRQMTASIS